MARLLSFLASAGVISSMLFRAVTPASACSCAVTTLEQHVTATEVIVVGSVTGSITQPPFDRSAPDDLQHRVYVRVAAEEYLKGGGPAEFSVATARTYQFAPDGSVVVGDSSCSFLGEWAVGSRFALFFSGTVENASDPGTCSASRALTGADDYVEQLRAILRTTPPPEPTVGPTTAAPPGDAPVGLPRSGGKSESDPTGTVLEIVLGLGSMVLGAGLVWRRYSRRGVGS